jgi:hypothetical protein
MPQSDDSTVDTHDDSSDGAGPPQPRFGPNLILAFECDRPTAGGARYALQEIDRVTIGRGPTRTVECHDEEGVRTLEIRVPGRSLSANHLRLTRMGSSWVLEDCESTNGTFVNGKREDRVVL